MSNGGYLSLLLLLCLGAAAAPAEAQRPLNLGFEQPSSAEPDRPWGWSLGWSAFGSGSSATISLDSLVRHGGRRSLRLAQGDSAPSTQPQAIMLQLPADAFHGRTVALTGWMRADRLHGRAWLALEAWKNLDYAAADTAFVTGNGPPQWARYHLRIKVPKDSTIHSIVISAVLEGSGTAWFDDLALRVDGALLAVLPLVAAPPTKSDLAWLSQHAVPLMPISDSNAAALKRFSEIVGPARVVGLGESTHGTREFFQLKARLLEYLVRVEGFRVFAIEANQLATERVNRYVEGGAGTARDVMRVMFRVWNTEEMEQLIEWIRRFNAEHPDRPVRFVGYDMQDQRTPADTLRAFLSRVEPSLLPTFDSLAGEYQAQKSYATPQVADTTRARWSDQASTLWAGASARRTVWLERAASAADTMAVEWAVQAANLFRQAARFNVTLNSPERDSLMAANLDWVLRTVAPGARAVVWAHDVHVSRGGDPELSFNGGAQMGAYLARIYGEGYRAFSLLTYEGAYTATRSFTNHEMVAVEAFPAPAGSLEAALHSLPRPPSSIGWLVDLRTARADTGGQWLDRPRPIRHIGYAAYDYGFEMSVVVPLEFDGVFFVDHTTPSRLLP